MIVTSPTMGFYVELCATGERQAILDAYQDILPDAAVMRLVAGDIRHAHQPNGECVKLLVRKNARRAQDMRNAIARAFISGHDMYRV